jgi:hypothetical protein
MRKLIWFIFLPHMLQAELISVELLCKGIEKIQNQEVTEMIRIDGNTLVHKVHGNHFLDVTDTKIGMLEMDDDKIGLSFDLDRKSGDIEIIRGWDKPYHFKGSCGVIRR